MTIQTIRISGLRQTFQHMKCTALKPSLTTVRTGLFLLLLAGCQPGSAADASDKASSQGQAAGSATTDAAAAPAAAKSATAQQHNPQVQVNTSAGSFQIELLPKLAPRSVANFLKLVDKRFYDGLIFHRVIAGFMVQGGGYTPDLVLKESGENIANESMNGLQNRKGSVALARLRHPDSANSQFYINMGDNPHLNASAGRPGFTVFGRITSGYDVVESIELVEVKRAGAHEALPLQPITITSIQRI